MTIPAPEPPEVAAEELAAAERWVREFLSHEYRHGMQIDVLMREFDRMRAELTRTVADCGICRLSARTVHIDDDCPRHGGDW